MGAYPGFYAVPGSMWPGEIWPGNGALPLPPVPPAAVVTLGEPCLGWATGDPDFRWTTGEPDVQWVTGGPYLS